MGHNLVDFDMAVIGDDLTAAGIRYCIDTLPLSALLYPEAASHALGKPEKISDDALNDPLTDAYKCRNLFLQEIQDYASLDEPVRMAYALLLQHHPYFRGWYALLRQIGDASAVEAWKAPRQRLREGASDIDPEHAAKTAFQDAPAQSAAGGSVPQADSQALRDGLELPHAVASLATQAIEEAVAARPDPCVCESADLAELAMKHPVELAYAFAYAMAPANTRHISEWALRRFPGITGVLDALCRTRCSSPSCRYCTTMLDATTQLRRIFGFESFRTWQGQDLQQQAVQAAIDGESIMAVFPTGGGKSLTFQLPAIIDGQSADGLTIVISPLQSLMVDQVNSLERRGIAVAATINGTLDPVQRTNQIERVRSGIASILYIAPESLRSPTIQRLVQARNVTRIVVDEAHCFSAWGQDFRVDYWYIGEFIRQLESALGRSVSVSCFTATAKKQVIADIRDYFHNQTGKALRLFATTAQRHNLHYRAIAVDAHDDAGRYRTLRELITEKDPCPPTIVFVARRKQATELADKLSRDGIPACAFHGGMSVVEKMTSQEAFLSGAINVMVATKAFGMGIDKSDVQRVIHYTVSESLEDYMQESGRAGRDEHIQADCIILYNADDLDVHFQMLNQSRLTMNQIQQVWQAVKHLSDNRHHGRMAFTASALEIAREAGWSNTSDDVETRVRAALMSLEQSGYIKRGVNASRVFADSLAVDDIRAARNILEQPHSGLAPEQIEECVRMLSYLLSRKYTGLGMPGEGESRVDYLADCLALPKGRVRDDIDEMKRLGILRNDTDMHAYVKRGKASGHSREDKLGEMIALENFLADFLAHGMREGQPLEYKEANEAALDGGITTSSVPKVKTIVASWIDARYIRKPEHPNASDIDIKFTNGIDEERFTESIAERQRNARVIGDHVVGLAKERLVRMRAEGEDAAERIDVAFSLVDLQRCCTSAASSFNAASSDDTKRPDLGNVRRAVLYLERANELDIEGGFLVSYNGMRITRVETDNRRRYRKEDYAQLDTYYRNRIEQIHLVGRFASLLIDDHDRAMQFAKDYFAMDHDGFLDKYVDKSERDELSLGMTKQRYDLLFSTLNEEQRRVID
ncbi:MAG: RecQ family ATP-dependent DNA helicase, partial [Bifidobacteriaceae bacterium]|nr:RecQ family ATP-dependent DNA helicase [Bifidobacteriaceae bacterium]